MWKHKNMFFSWPCLQLDAYYVANNSALCQMDLLKHKKKTEKRRTRAPFASPSLLWFCRLHSTRTLTLCICSRLVGGKLVGSFMMMVHPKGTGALKRCTISRLTRIRIRKQSKALLFVFTHSVLGRCIVVAFSFYRCSHICGNLWPCRRLC